MKSDGSYTDDDWAEIYTAGGASALPSSLSTHYGVPHLRTNPSAATAWILSLFGIALFVPALIGLVLALRAARGGNRWAWLAAAANVASMALCIVFWMAAANVGSSSA